jgi:sugar lactone lactonase YvrE
MMPSVQLLSSKLSSLPVRLFLLPVLMAGLLLPAMARAQVSFTGASPSVNFGSQAIGTPSAAQTLSFSVSSGTTVGSIGVLTQGAANLDFANAAGSTCTATTYSTAANCTVNVTFTPMVAGLRMGAVVFFSGTNRKGTVLANVPVYGVGSGPQIAFNPAPAVAFAPTANGKGLNYPTGVAVDGAGNLFIADNSNNRVVKVPAGGGTAIAIDPVVNGEGLSFPQGVAVDGAGDLFIADLENFRVAEVPAGGGAAIAINPKVNYDELWFAYGVAVDGAGDLFIADSGDERVVEVPAGGGAAIAIDPTVNGEALHLPYGVAVDGAGDLFIADTDNNRVVEVPAGGGAATAIDPVVNGAGLSYPKGLAFDGAGDLFIADTDNNRVVVIPAGGAAAIAISPIVNGAGLNDPSGVAVDGAGDLFIADYFNRRIVEIQRSQPPAVNFPTLTDVDMSDSIDGVQTVEVQNIGNQALVFAGVNYPVDFPAPGGLETNWCFPDTSLSAGQFCNVEIGFYPQNVGTLNEDLTVNDNALNVTAARQLIPVSGTALPAGSAIRFYVEPVTAASVVAGVPFTIRVRALDSLGETVTGYNGTVAFTSSDPGFVNPGTLTLSGGAGKTSVTLETAGTQTITATDTTNSALTGTGSFAVAEPQNPVLAPGSVNFGSQAIGSPSGAQTLNFSVVSGATVGSIAVLTQGAPNLDFTNAAGSTCTATTYTSATSCTVNVTFTPKAAGLRMGAVVFFSGAGNTGTVLANVPIYGIGTGPQIAYSPSTAIAIAPTAGGKGLSEPDGAAVDSVGDLFISDEDNNRIVEVPAGGGAAIAISPVVNGEGLNNPTFLAVDGAGDLFIADAFNNRVVEVPAGGGAATAISPTVSAPTLNTVGLDDPAGVAVDGAGDLFIADFNNNRVVEVPAGGGVATAIDPVVNGEGLLVPQGLAVDGAGDLFIGDYGNNRVVEVPAGGGAAIAIGPTVNGMNLIRPTSVSVDGAGDLFILDFANGRVVEAPAGGGAAIAFAPTVNGVALNFPGAASVDSAGDLFIVDSNNNRVVEVQRPQPPTVNFPTATIEGTTDTLDGTKTVEVQNIGNQALSITGVSYPADFPEAGGDANACTGSTSLSAGQECDVPIEFAPQSSGSLIEYVTLTDNALNVTGAQQSITVKGTGQVLAQLTSPVPGSVLPGSSVAFTWSAGTGPTSYQLWMSEAWIGGHDLYNSGITTATTETVTVPANGVTLYVRFSQFIDGHWQATDYTYTEAGTPAQPEMLSPAPGSVLPGSSVAFTWTAGSGATAYQLLLGTTGVGSDNLYDSKPMTATTVTVDNLPTSGVTVYARLWSLINRQWQTTDYTYTEAGTPVLAAMTSPAPGSVLTGSSVPFTWSAGSGPTAYQLTVSAAWIGGNDLYNSGSTTATTETVTVPANGVTLYVRLSQRIDGLWQSTDYTYTEAGTAAQAVMISPAPGSVLPGSSVAFTWTAGSGPTAYQLLLGTTGVGSDNLYNSKPMTATTVTVNNLPTSGVTVYARLWSLINRQWQTTDYTYTAQ